MGYLSFPGVSPSVRRPEFSLCYEKHRIRFWEHTPRESKVRLMGEILSEMLTSTSALFNEVYVNFSRSKTFFLNCMKISEK